MEIQVARDMAGTGMFIFECKAATGLVIVQSLCRSSAIYLTNVVLVTLMRWISLDNSIQF